VYPYRTNSNAKILPVNTGDSITLRCSQGHQVWVGGSVLGTGGCQLNNEVNITCGENGLFDHFPSCEPCPCPSVPASKTLSEIPEGCAGEFRMVSCTTGFRASFSRPLSNEQCNTGRCPTHRELYSSRCRNTHFAVIRNGSEEGSYSAGTLRLVDFCITKLWAESNTAAEEDSATPVAAPLERALPTRY
jgi:hypothetical protein